MQMSKNDQAILSDMEKQFEKMTGEKPTHVFIDTADTINENGMCFANKGDSEENYGEAKEWVRHVNDAYTNYQEFTED